MNFWFPLVYSAKLEAPSCCFKGSYFYIQPFLIKKTRNTTTQNFLNRIIFSVKTDNV